MRRSWAGSVTTSASRGAGAMRTVMAADQAALLASAEAEDAEHAWVLDQAEAEEERCVAILLRQTEETRTLGFGEVLLSPTCAEEEERALALALAASRTDYGPDPADTRDAGYASCYIYNSNL